MNLKSLINNLRINAPALQRVFVSTGKTSKKGFSLANWILANKRKAQAITLASALFAGGVTLAATSGQSSAPAPENTNSGYVQTWGSEEFTGTDTSQTQDDFKLFADQFEGIDVNMNNHMKTEEEVATSLGATYTGSVTTAENGTSWASEEDLTRAEEAGLVNAPEGTEKVTYSQEVFIANDGKPFITKADADAWNAQLEADKKGNGEATTGNKVIETEGNFYVAPDGTVWQTKQDYENILASENGTKETTIENGQVVETDGKGGYQDPNGEWWTSKEEYDAYINGLNNNTNNVTGSEIGTGNIINQGEENIQKDQYGGYTDSEGYYHAQDGYVYEDLSDYLGILNGVQNTNNTDYENTNNNNYNNVGGNNGYTEESIQKDQYGGYVGEDGYYHASNGYAYETLQDYLNDINTAQMTATTNTLSSTSTEYTAYSTYSEDTSLEETTTTTTTLDASTTGQTETTTLESNQMTDQTGTTTLEEEQTDTELENQEEITTQEEITYDEYGGYVGQDGYYHAKNGFIYETLQDYLNEILYGSAEELGDSEKTM